ncbi:hypothetical protein GGR51DRAFT_487232 [Nemania sp. FL0031]|nr:hypothetical protein GGR51DRAFT_487232 [Nemania sp. FL0031]
MTDPRARHSGRRSPTFNPARASMPVNIGGYSLPYTGEIHAVPTSRYDASVPRRHDPKPTSGPAPPATTITTYNVTKDPMSRSLSRSNRNRSSTVDSHTGKTPIIVTTSHPRPHVSSSHASNSVRASSPSRDTYRPSDSTYYAVQPASSMRARSHHRHSYHQGAPLGDELHRLRERVRGPGETRAAAEPEYWGPSRTSTDNFRNPRPHVLYTTATHPTHPTHPPAPAYANTSAIIDYDDDYYEYTKPGELARYDLDHDRDRRSRRDSVDRPYYRPHVNVVSHDTTTRYEQPRTRTKPPTSAGLDRYNRTTAVSAYDRPSVTMTAPPAVPPPPPIDTARRPAALLEAPRSPSTETRTSRPRPVSLYQEGPARSVHADDLHRSRDDERVGKDRRDRDDPYRDENVATRGFGIRTETSDQPPARTTTAPTSRDHDERRPRRDTVDRESKRGSDESLVRVRSHDRDAIDSHRSRFEESRDRREAPARRESMSRTRDIVGAGIKGALAAVGLGQIIGQDDKDVSPRRRTQEDDDREYNSRAGESSKFRERESAERRSSPTNDSIPYERREPREERTESVPGSKDREYEANRDRERDRDRDRDREREREHDYGKERERERDREDERDQRERQWQEAEAKLNGSTSDRRAASPDDQSNIGRRRQRAPSGFDPTDTKGLMDLKADLVALENQKESEKANGSDIPPIKETAPLKAASGTNGIDRGDESATESRGREVVPAQEKQVRVVSPPRDKAEPKPIKGILKPPSAKFPEDSNPIREGVAPHKDDQTKKDVPAGARWTKISRSKVNPEALTAGKERFETRDDFVIVLRVLNKEEIEAYAIATAQIREKHKRDAEKGSRSERYSDEEQTRSDEERQRRRRHHQEKEDEEYRRGRADDRHRRHRYDDGSESRPKTIEYPSGHRNRH